MHHDIAKDISMQVEMMVYKAKQASELQVRKEIQKIKTKLEGMQEKMKLISERCVTAEQTSPSGGLTRDELNNSIVRLEEVWETEVGALKHELWQTIQAHNHNADLLKHHKEAIDSIGLRIKETQPSPDTENLQTKLAQLEKLIQSENQKDHQISQLIQRLTHVQNQMAAGAAAAANPWPGMPPGGAGFPAMTAGGAATTASNAGKKAKAKATKPAKAKAVVQGGCAGAGAPPQAGGAGATAPIPLMLRAEAPEFVPGSSG